MGKVDDAIEKKIAELSLLLGLILIFSVTPLIVLASGVYWLKNKVWPDWSASGFGLSAPVTSWAGANYLVDSLYHLHIGWVALLIAIAAIVVGTQLARD